MSVCPGNSTECLLRALVDESSGYNWNPLTFAFTAILSTLALALAFVTLIQAFLASGPGRLKASLGAIGSEYHKTTRTKFDRAELRFRTTVSVPKIDIDTILHHLPIERSAHGVRSRTLSSLRIFVLERLSVARGLLSRRPAQRRNLSEDAESGQLMVVATEKPIKEHQQPHASWGQMLFETGLEQLPFLATQCRTDYLPNEVQAAPAYATVEALLFLSIVLGCTSYTMTEQGVAAFGPGIQLQLRENQTLGRVAIFQRYNDYWGTEAFPASIDRTRLSCEQGLGDLNYLRTPVLRFSCTPSTPKAPNTLDYTHSSPLRENIEKHYLGCNHQRCRDRNRLVSSWKTFLEHQVSYDSLTVIGFLFADKPKFLSMFPTQTYGQRRVLRKLRRAHWPAHWRDEGFLRAIQSTTPQGQVILFENSNFEVHVSSDSFAGLQGLKEHHVMVDATVNAYDVELLPVPSDSSEYTNGSSWFEDGTVPRRRPRDRSFPLSPDTLVNGQAQTSSHRLYAGAQDLIVSNLALETVGRWVLDKEEFNGKDCLDRIKMLSYQLEEIDWFLYHHGGQVALCAALNVLSEVDDLRQGYITDRRETRRPRQTAGQGDDLVRSGMELVPYRAQTMGDLNRQPNFSPIDRSSTYRSLSDRPQNETLVESPIAVSEDGSRQNPESRAETSSVQRKDRSFRASTRNPTATSLGSSSQHEADEGSLKTEDEPVLTEKPDSSPALKKLQQVYQQILEPPPADTSQSETEPSPTITSEQQLEGFEALLVYRACVYGTLMALTTDTSNILESMERSKIVQVL